MITGHAMVCGVIGNPVGHSLSPLMHNFCGQALGLDYIYVPCHVQDDRVGEAVRGAFALGFTGINVTVPHKQRVMPYLAELDDSAKSIGAVNTLVRCEKGYKGYNTDADGLGRAMKENGMEIGGRRCILLGAGGAAKAAAYLFMREKAESVVILNRSLEKARSLADEMNGKAGRQFMQALPLQQWRQLEGDSYLAVQTTSVGMHPNEGHAVIEDREFYKKISQAADAVYTPARTRFMEYVEEAGGQAVNGLDMLIYQGIAAFELWNPQVKVPDDVIGQVREMMEERLHG